MRLVRANIYCLGRCHRACGETVSQGVRVLPAVMSHWPASGFQAIRAVLSDIAVGVMDTGQAPVPIGDLGIAAAEVDWLKHTGEHLVYVFHHCTHLDTKPFGGGRGWG